MRKVLYFLVFLLTPIFSVSAGSLIDWEGAFNGFYLEFLKSLFWFFKIAWPFIVGLIIFKILCKKLEKKIIEWKNSKKRKNKSIFKY
jgi:Kef-type K+ transport system membrane component KefB